MKLLFVIDSFRMGGAEKSLVTLLNLLPAADGMDIEVMRMANTRAVTTSPSPTSRDFPQPMWPHGSMHGAK